MELHGPTNFSMFLDKAIEMASKPVDQGNQRYYLLLVITVRLLFFFNANVLYILCFLFVNIDLVFSPPNMLFVDLINCE